MKFTVSCAKTTSSSDAGLWGGCFAENGIFVLLETKGTEDLSAQLAGKEILDTILTQYTNIKKLDSEAMALLLDSITGSIQIKTLLIGVLQEEYLHLSSRGDAKVLIIRNGKMGLLLKGSARIRGKIQKGDRLLFYSNQLDLAVNFETKKKILEENDPEQAAQTLTPLLISQSNVLGVAVLILHIKEEVKPAKSTPLRRFSLKDKLAGLSDLGKNIEHALFTKGRKVQETDEERKSKKTLLSIAVILVLLLIFSIFFNINHTVSSKRGAKLAETLDLINHQYSEAENLIDLNPSRARTLLADSKLSLSQSLSEFPENSKEYTEINQWLMKISEKEVEAYKIYVLTTAPLFFDLELIKKDGQGDKIASFADKKVILDMKNQVVYSIFSKTKESSIIAGKEVVKDAGLITVYGADAYILNSDGLVGINLASKQSKVMVKKDDTWGQIAGLAAFGGNLYLLDKTNNSIWKYIRTDFGFSLRTRYLNPDTIVDFSVATGMAIDGSVWVYEKGYLEKFEKGIKAEFEFKGLADTISDIGSVSVNDESEYIYVLDKNLSRILVFDKEGTYQSQYQWSVLKDASDLAVSQEEGKLYVLMGSKIYAIDLK